MILFWRVRPRSFRGVKIFGSGEGLSAACVMAVPAGMVCCGV